MTISRMCTVEMARLVSNERPGDPGLIDSSQAHDTAAFLPWHRSFIQIYEKALREQCAYSGHLTYVQDSEYRPSELSDLPDTGIGLSTGKMSPTLLSGTPSSDSAAMAMKKIWSPFTGIA